MNRVRRVSRKYAELYNRPDHIARVTARDGRRRHFLRVAQAKNIVDEAKPKLVDNPRTNGRTEQPSAKPGILKRLFRRSGQR